MCMFVLQRVTEMPCNMQHTLQQPAICMCKHAKYTATTCIMHVFEFVTVCVAVRIAVRVAVHDALRVVMCCRVCRRVYCSVSHREKVLQSVAKWCRVHQSDWMFLGFVAMCCKACCSVHECLRARQKNAECVSQ